MYVNPDKKLLYVAHPRTASRETSQVLKKRGFKVMCGHHGVPWGPDWNTSIDRVTKPKKEVFWWFNQPAHEYTIVSTVRNHFDVFASLTLMFPKDMQNPGTAAKWLWSHPHHYRNLHQLWPTIHEFPDRQQRVMRAETLRDDVSQLLEEHLLNPLNEDELVHETSYTRTKGKEIGVWREVLSDRMVDWISTTFRWEIDHLGYAF